MANMFMKLGNLKIKKGKGATALITGGDKNKKSDYFGIRSMNWRVTRDVDMEVGDANNQDNGIASMSQITVTKEMDGASEVILSRILVPGKYGDTVDIVITKPDRKGGGAEVYLHIQLKHARVCEADINIAEGARPFECYALAYSRILIKHWNEDEGGALQPGGDVTFDLPTAKAMSHAIQQSG
ncbi:type VI secretion system tube protein Hcp [Endozoicomonas gorgoniicola]|uniref:Type VI secretion system tube protein Hcp n=1 Tax=Endozoicomonas gorgoniicola TaxID=1234144 RepID=A0ABT3MPU0_9GAMM|nr:type VI secretion system tube protein Hcp [Endozoicomonas gorgoniicola]MCW7551128.1 type VI secretion system tube protein Hcp [Endozoicomonas gorgoniicola]